MTETGTAHTRTPQTVAASTVTESPAGMGQPGRHGTNEAASRTPAQRLLWALIFVGAAICGVGLVVITARLFGELVLG